jgi:hypothetical protein
MAFALYCPGLPNASSIVHGFTECKEDDGWFSSFSTEYIESD